MNMDIDPLCLNNSKFILLKYGLNNILVIKMKKNLDIEIVKDPVL